VSRHSLSRHARIRLRAAALATLLMLASATAWAAEPAASEHAVKAAIVYKIAKFVSWPEDSSAANPQLLPICLPESDPIGPAMDALAGKTVQGRTIEIRRFEESTTLTDDCAILFVSKSAALRRPSLLSDVANSPVLTIGDSADFADIGGIVMLEVANSRVQFAISMSASDRAGLGISAQLLQLAKLLR
jgi:hypothetical protein